MASLADQIRAIDNALRTSMHTLEDYREGLAKVEELKLTAIVGSEEFAQIEKLDKAIRDVIADLKQRGTTATQTSKAAADALERERRSMERLLSTHKDLIKLYNDTIGKIKILDGTIRGVTKGFEELTKKGDIGSFIQQVTQAIPGLRWLGLGLGTIVTYATQAQDKIQGFNKTIIQSQAALGRFGQGMEMTKSRTLGMRQELANFATTTGISTAELQKHVESLSATGFGLDEMGVDEQTGKVATFADAVGGLSGKFGVLSSSIMMARMTGLDMGTVMDQMGFQMKTMGDTSEQSVKTFAALTVAANKSGVSTNILLPNVRRLQEQFKFLGIDAAKTTLTLGNAGLAARRAGLGPAAGVELMGRAIGGLQNASFGTQAFLGQRMGLGGGLAAGFQFREQLGTRGAEFARGTVGGAQQMFGGRSVSLAEARTSPQAAALRLGQEQLVAQLMGVTQTEARGIIEMTDKLTSLEASGDATPEEIEKVKDELKKASMSEKDYAEKTLTVQEKIANYMEFLTATMSRVFLSFIRGFAGGAAGAMGIDNKAFEDLFKAIEEGKGVDVPMKALVSSLDAASPKITAWASDLGQSLGGLTGTIMDYWKWLAGLYAGFQGIRLVQWFNTLTKGTQTVAQGMASTGGALKTIASVLTMPAWTAIKMGIGKLAYFLTPGGVLIAGLAALAVAVKWAADTANEATKNRVESENQLQGSINRIIQQAAGSQADLQKVTGRSGVQALDLMKKQKAGGLTGEEADVLKKFGKEIAAQAYTEAEKQRAQMIGSGGTTTRGALSFGVTSNWSIGGHSTLQKGGAKAEDVAAISKVASEMRAAAEALGGHELLAGMSAKPATKDAWDVQKPGWLYASQGDAVVDARSLGIAMRSGNAGAALDVGGAQRNIFEGMRSAAPMGAKTPMGGADAREHDIVFNIKAISDKLGVLVDERIAYNVERDIVMPGKSGTSKLSKGSDNKGY